MNWVDIVWPMLGAASLMLGLIHLLIWFQQRNQPAHLMFGLVSGSVAVLAIFELLLIKSQSPERYSELLRWAHVPVAVMVCALVGFVMFRFDIGRPWLAISVCALRVGGLVANFASGVNLNFRQITGLQQHAMPGEGFVSIPVGEANPWMLLGQLSNLLLVVFLIDAVVTSWNGRTSDERRRIVLVCGSMIVFAIMASTWTALVVTGRVYGPLSINFAFFAVLMVMSYELGGDAIRAAQLARQLSESESSLRDSQQRMQLAARAAGLALWTWDLRSNESWFTETGSVLLNLAPNEHIDGKNFLDRVHPDDRAAIMQAREDAIHRTGEYTCEYRLPGPDGSVRWIASQGRVEYAPSGDPLFLRGVILDITDRRQAEEHFRVVVERAPNAILMIDSEGLITLANVQAEQVFGYGRTELLGQHVDMLIPEHSHVRHASHPADTQARAAAPAQSMFVCRKDGVEIPVEVDLNPIRIGDGIFVLASIVDISQRLNAEQELALQRDELAHLSRVALLGEMSGSLAHELNQPLTAVLSNAQAALRFLEHDPPNYAEVRESLIHIVENDKRAGEVIRRLRAMLRKEAVAYQKLDINDVVQDVLRLIASDILNRNVTVSLDLADELPAVSGDRVQLQQVLLNLVINACDAMDGASGRVLEVRTRLAEEQAIEVSISDVGRGIPPDDLELIFAPFFTSKKEGMGLGLAVCRTITQAHHGTLWATNNAARGATLHFQLPIDIR